MVAAVENRSFILDAQCWRCGSTTLIILNKEDLVDWMSGSGPVEEVLYYLSPSERELLISNTCGSCFDSLFEDLDSDE